MIFNIYLYNKYKYFVKMEKLDTKNLRKKLKKYKNVLNENQKK